jgi:hypothetical protein
MSHRHLVIDLSVTTFVDCAALRELPGMVSPLQDLADTAVVFMGADGVVRRLLELLDFDAVIGIVESPEIAIAAWQLEPGTLPDGWRRAPDGGAYDAPKIRAAAAMISACGTSRTWAEMFQR